MSDRYELYMMFTAVVTALFPITYQYEYDVWLAKLRVPYTTVACPFRIGVSSCVYSAGSYSRSASWMMTYRPRASLSAVRTADPLPALTRCLSARTRG